MRAWNVKPGMKLDMGRGYVRTVVRVEKLRRYFGRGSMWRITLAEARDTWLVFNDTDIQKVAA